MEERIAELERTVRSMRRALYAALAGIAVLGGGAIVACKSKAKPMTQLVFADENRKMTLDAGGLRFTQDKLGPSTAVSAFGVTSEKTDETLGKQVTNIGGGLVAIECEGSMVQMGANKLGGQILITDTQNATTSLGASQGMGTLQLWAKETRVELSAAESYGAVSLRKDSEARLSVSPESADLKLDDKRISSDDK